jgi:inner membrane transporter RhtA
VLLFTRVDVLGVAWLRIASAAAVFTLWRRPWQVIGRLSAAERWNLVTLGLVLAVMNSVFYLAVDRLPLSTVGAIEFLGTVGAGRSAARVSAPGVAAGRSRGGRVLLGDPLRDRSAGYGPVAPRDVLPDAGLAAGLRHRHRRDRAAPDPDRP